jgi:predicted ribosomally synthesized peptide with SipW-like signal peptide
MSRGKLRLLLALGFVALMLFGTTTAAFADQVVVAQNPYEAPDIDEVEPPGWLAFFEPLAALPLWGQAAVLSAGVAGLFFIIPLVGKWVWRLGEGKDEDEDGDTDL